MPATLLGWGVAILAGIVVFLWVGRYASLPFAIAVSILLMLCPPIVDLGRETTADGLATLIAFTALFLIFAGAGLDAQTPPTYKRVPPAGVQIPENDRKELEAGAAALRSEIDSLSRDPRLSVAERYASRDEYIGKFAEAAMKLVHERFLLREDLPIGF